MSIEDASEKITAFMTKYGEKGFLTLYFSNYLYEMILSYLRAHSDTPSKDSAYEFHFGKSGKLRTVKDDESFRQALRHECDEKASRIVTAFEKQGLLVRFSGDLDSITTRATRQVDEALKEIFEKVLETKWGVQT